MVIAAHFGIKWCLVIPHRDDFAPVSILAFPEFKKLNINHFVQSSQYADDIFEPTRARVEVDGKLLSFETITFAPLDRALIVTSLLSQDERAWIDDYHAQTLTKIAPRLDGAALDWLKGACAPL